MKKFLLVLGMITCMAGLTACGQEAKDYSADYQISAEGVTAYVEQQVAYMDSVVDEAAQAYIAEDAVMSNAVAGWESALADMGDYQSVENVTYIVDEDGIMTIDAEIKGIERDADITFILEYSVVDGFKETSITTSPRFTFAETMTKAGLNTLMGMGTVFAVLILIALLIYCFNFIPKIQAAFSKKEKKAEVAADNAVAQIVENETVQEEDDLELIAVIAAAIAASEGASSADGYVVRSIRRIR